MVIIIKLTLNCKCMHWFWSRRSNTV